MANEQMMESLMPKKRAEGAVTQSLSYSRARVFDECPAKFKAEYIVERARGGVSEPHLIMGSIGHEACDRYVKHLKESNQGSDYDAMDRIAEEVWNSSERAGLSEFYKDEYLGLIENAKECLIFPDIGLVHSSEMKVAVDRDWNPCDYASGEAFVRGRIDRVDMDHDWNVTIVDYKTGRRIDPVEGSKQLQLYARIARAYWPAAVSITVSLVYIRFKIRRSLTIIDGDMEKGREWIEAVGRGIEKAIAQDHFPARPGQACRGCPIFKGCAARERTGKITPPGDEAQAYALVERLIMVERERKDIQEALGGWIDDYGAIEVNGMVLGLFPAYSVDWDAAQVAGILERHGLRPLDYMNVSAQKLKTVVRRDQSLQIELDAVKVDASTTKLLLKRSVEEFKGEL